MKEGALRSLLFFRTRENCRAYNDTISERETQMKTLPSDYDTTTSVEDIHDVLVDLMGRSHAEQFFFDLAHPEY